MKNGRTIKAIIIFLVVFVAGAGLSWLLRINNGLLPSVLLGAGIAIWYYQFYKR